MARNKEEYTCTATYTEGCERRLTEALVELYYQRKQKEEIERMTKKEKTA